MDDVQSWWEVPAIAHFCYVFRDVFNLIYFEIAELESALLHVQDPEMSISVEQLITRLLQGCFDEDDVTSDNWEEKLHELFEENSDGENPIKGSCFQFLTPRSKVEVLHKLCEYRLDAEGALDEIKDIPADKMKASCVGKDSKNNVYWYFCDERLYKEDPSVKSNKKPAVAAKNVNKSSTVKNGKRSTTRERKTVVTENKSWSVACYNINDWEELLKGFSKSKSTHEKELVSQIKNTYLPLLKDVVSEKDRLLRKRFVELAPKRVSSRISKVQAQKKMEEQKAADAAESKRLQQEEERAKKEAEKKIKEKEERTRRAEERQNIILSRSQRVKQREMMRGIMTDDSESSSEESHSVPSQPKRTCRSRKPASVEMENSDDSNNKLLSDDSEDSEDDNALSEMTQSSENSTRQSSVANSSDEDSDVESKLKLASKNITHSIASRQEKQGKVVRNLYNSKCNVQVGSKGQRLSCITYNQIVENKRIKMSEAMKNLKSVNAIPSKEALSTYYPENKNWYLKTCTKVTNSPAIIRIDFIKPPPKPQG